MNIALTTHYLFELLICSSILILLAGALTKTVRAWSAAIRHRVWLLSFATLALLPLALMVLPSMNLPILPLVAQKETPQVRHFDSTAYPASSAAERTDRPTVPTPPENNTTNHTSATNNAPSQWIEPTNRLDISNDTSLVPIAPKSQPKATSSPTSSVDHGWWLLVVWTCGFLAVLGSLGIAILSNRRIILDSRIIAAPPWDSLLSELCEKLNIRGPVTLLSPVQPVMPMTIGAFQPTIVLPAEADAWSPNCRRAVLAHELAHIKRYDVLAQTFARMVSGLYWFNPLVWIALRQLRIERELACDDCVVASGQKPSEYARELVQIARSYRLPSNLVGAAMASTSKLEYRIQSLLDLARSHVPVSNNAAWKLIVCAIVVTVGLSTVRLVPQSVSGLTVPSIENETISTLHDEVKTFRGSVVDADGKPVPNAQVAFVHSRIKSRGYNFGSNEIITTASTDASGAFELAVPNRLIQGVSDRRPGALIRSGNNSFEEQLSIVATKPNLGTDWHTVFDLLHGLPNSDVELTLHKETTIHGRVVDQEGNPIQNVEVRPYSIFKGYAGTDWDQWCSTDFNSGFPIADVCCTQDNPLIDQTILSDDNGEFQLNGFAPNQLVTLEVSGNGVAKTRITVVTRKLETPLQSQRTDRRYLVNLYFGAEFELVAPPEQKIFGRIVDKDTQQPIQGIKVDAHEGFLEVITDKNGRYELSGLPRPADEDEPVRISLTPNHDLPYLGATYVKVPRADVLESVEFNLEFKKAVWLQGTLTDHATGKPEMGHVGYTPNLDNDIAKTYERYTPGTLSILPRMVPTDLNGKFKIPVIPGRGIVVATGPQLAKFEVGFGEQDGENLPRGLNSNVFMFYELMSVDAVNSVMTLEILNGAKPKDIEISLRRLPSKTLKLRDSNNNKLDNVRTIGIFPNTMTSPQQRLESNAGSSNDEVEVYGLENGDGRMMLFHQSERNIGLATVIQDDGPEEIVLQPCGTIRGKFTGLIDYPNYPNQVTACIPANRLPETGNPEFNSRPLVVARANVSKDGSFELSGVVPGVELKLLVQGQWFSIKKTNAKLEPGEAVDVGTLDLEISQPKDSDAKMATKAENGMP